MICAQMPVFWESRNRKSSGAHWLPGLVYLLSSRPGRESTSDKMDGVWTMTPRFSSDCHMSVHICPCTHREKHMDIYIHAISKEFFVFCICVFCLHLCMCAMVRPCFLGGQRKALNLLELKLQMVVNGLWALTTKPGSSVKAARAPHCWAVSVAPHANFEDQ